MEPRSTQSTLRGVRGPAREGRPTRFRKVWREIKVGRVWIVDADLKDFFGSVDHSLLMQLVARRISDGRVLTLIEQMLRAPIQEGKELTVPNKGTPQGGVVSPALSNILLTPFDREMRARGYHLTRFADDSAPGTLMSQGGTMN